MRFCMAVALLSGALAAIVNDACAQNGPKMDSIVQPIVPDAQPGLPDKAPSASGTPSPATAAEPAGKAPARKAGAADAGEWKTECPKQGATPKCQAIVRATVGGQTALVMAVAKTAANSRARFQMAVPLGLSIQKGVKVKLGDYSGDFSISRCTAQGCLVEADAPAALIESLEKEPAGQVVIYSDDNKPIHLPLPAKGFGGSFAALEATE
jgi:invasion protein IalB